MTIETNKTMLLERVNPLLCTTFHNLKENYKNLIIQIHGDQFSFERLYLTHSIKLSTEARNIQEFSSRLDLLYIPKSTQNQQLTDQFFEFIKEHNECLDKKFQPHLRSLGDEDIKFYWVIKKFFLQISNTLKNICLSDQSLIHLHNDCSKLALKIENEIDEKCFITKIKKEIIEKNDQYYIRVNDSEDHIISFCQPLELGSQFM